MDSKILLIEDDFDVREALADTLVEEGYSIDSAADGQEALDLLRAKQTQPALILLDLMMPRMSGTEFLAVVRQDPVLTRIPVVVLSADPRLAEKARLMGTEAVIRKPVDVDDLVATIERLLPGPR